MELQMKLIYSPKNSLSIDTGFMRQLRQKPIVTDVSNFLAPILTLFRNLLLLFETNRGGHPPPFKLNFDGLSFAKNPKQIGWELGRSQNLTYIYIYLGRAVFSTRTLRISALGKTGRKFKKNILEIFGKIIFLEMIDLG